MTAPAFLSLQHTVLDLSLEHALAMTPHVRITFAGLTVQIFISSFLPASGASFSLQAQRLPQLLLPSHAPSAFHSLSSLTSCLNEDHKGRQTQCMEKTRSWEVRATEQGKMCACVLTDVTLAARCTTSLILDFMFNNPYNIVTSNFALQGRPVGYCPECSTHDSKCELEMRAEDTHRS
eukprot:974487-Rhodomonas_salina.2